MCSEKESYKYPNIGVINRNKLKKKRTWKKQEVHCKLEQPTSDLSLLKQHLYSQQPCMTVTLALS